MILDFRFPFKKRKKEEEEGRGIEEWKIHSTANC